jgi:hypothetical protein
MEIMTVSIKKFFQSKWLAYFFSIAGFVLYYLRSIGYAFSERSSLDEGMYLVKGFWFASGLYQPYQPFGPWINKMPLSFLIPGWVETIFGAGLRTGRYYAVAVGLLMLVGLWLCARQLGGSGWAAAAVCVTAINAEQIREYSQAISQGLVACLLVWCLFLVLGERKPRWQLMAGSVMAGIIVLTRENMLPVAPWVILLIFWQYGWKTGSLSLLFCGLTVAVGHAFFWPDILRNWARLIPASLTPFLNPWRVPITGTKIYVQNFDNLSRLFVFFEGLRNYFVSMVGATCAWVLWPARKDWKADWRFKTAVFLSTLFVVLIIAHFWAAAGNEYCLYCYIGYLSFFSLIGLLLLIVSFPVWVRQIGRLRGAIAGLITLISATGLGFGAYQEFNHFDWFVQFLNWLMNLPIARIKHFQILPGNVPLLTLLSYKIFLVSEEDMLLQVAPRVIPVLIGALVGIVLLIASFWIYRVLAHKGRLLSFGSICLVLFLLTGTILSPTTFFSGSENPYDCRGNVINKIEAAGKNLAERIPAGSWIDWRGGVSPVILLYLPQARFYPPQLNEDYAKRLGGNADELFRYGFWNDELAQRWLNQSDFVLVEANTSTDLEAGIKAASYHELEPPPELFNCGNPVQLRIFSK